MSAEQWIVIPRWHGRDGFQHYKDRDPKWIKVYTRLHHDDGFRALSGHQRAVLLGLWLEYASSDGQLRVNTTSLTARLGLRVSSRQLEALNHAGFVQLVASKPIALSYKPASLEVETEKEIPPLPPPQGGERITGRKSRRAEADEQILTCPKCRLPFKARTLLDEHVYHSHNGPEPAHWTLPVEDPEPSHYAEPAEVVLPPPEERAAIAAALRASLLGAAANGASDPDELPWEGDEPPVVE